MAGWTRAAENSGGSGCVKKRWKLTETGSMTGKIAVFLVFLCILQNMGTVFDKKTVAKSVQKRAEERYLPSLSYLKAEPVLAPGEWIAKQAMQICLPVDICGARSLSGIAGG